jgi:hypothetical protein
LALLKCDKVKHAKLEGHRLPPSAKFLHDDPIAPDLVQLKLDHRGSLGAFRVAGVNVSEKLAPLNAGLSASGASYRGAESSPEPARVEIRAAPFHKKL